jgi:hypothetical protein
MRLLLPFALVASCAGGAPAASGSSASGSSSSSATASSSSTSGVVASSGECQADADCPGGTCVELTPGGYRVCRVTPQPITSCAPGEMGCCNSNACPQGQRCFPPVGYCGGLVGPMNRCLGDGCQADGDCDAGVCAPAGDIGLFVNTCVATTGCRQNQDCVTKPGGVCRPIEDACCNDVFALFCWYPGDCTRKADCGGNACGDPTTGRATCATTKPMCPT